MGGDADDRVIGHAQFLEFLHGRTNHIVELGHSGLLLRPTVFRRYQARIFFEKAGVDVHL